MYKRLELHNHTTESDSSLTCQELVAHMLSDSVDAFALSGHRKIRAILQETGAPIDCIYGMEYTTYYGHILCLNLEEYVPWENINRHRPELLFAAAKEKGALTGIAHPFSYGDPFARGCRFEMTVTDYSAVDFIEIFNNPEPLHEVNEPGLLLWENLVLKGYRLAATCGMDLHGKWSFTDQYATFIEGEKNGDIASELAEAIHSCRTWVSRGPLLIACFSPEENTLTFSVQKSTKPGFVYPDSYQLVIRTVSGDKTFPLQASGSVRLCADLFGNDRILIPKLYGNTTALEDLYCVSPVITL